MTVSNVNNRMDYLGDGSTDTYAYTFRIFDDGDLEVYRTTAGVEAELALTTDFTVDGAGDENGGDVVLVAGDLAASDTLAVLRVLPLTQPTSLRAFGPTFAAIEDALDRGIMIDQQLQEQIDRCYKVSVGNTLATLAFPDPVPLDLLRWNAAGDALENVDPSTLFEDVVMTGDFVVDTFKSANADFTPGVTTTLTLSQAPGTGNNLALYFNGLLQDPLLTYTLAGAVVTFLVAIPLGVTIISARQSHTLPINVLGAATVPTAAIIDGAVTTAKIAALAVDSTKLALGAVGLPQIAAGLLQSGRNFLVDGSMMLAGGADRAVAAGDPYGYGKADHWYGKLTVSGNATLSRSLTSAFGRTGRSLKWTTTAAGASVLTTRSFIEAIDAAGMKNKTVSLSMVAGHDAGANRNYTINVYKANAVDDFSAVTAIRSGTPVAVATDVGTLVAERAIAMGDCSNGVMVEVVIASGIVTAKHFEFTEVQLELGAQETEYEFPRYADVEARGSWYFERVQGDPNNGGSAVDLAVGVCTGAGNASVLLNYRPKRALGTLTTFVRNGFYVIDYTGTTVQTTGGSGSTSTSCGRRSHLLSVTVAAGLTSGRPCWLRTKDASLSYITIDARFAP